MSKSDYMEGCLHVVKGFLSKKLAVLHAFTLSSLLQASPALPLRRWTAQIMGSFSTTTASRHTLAE